MRIYGAVVMKFVFDGDSKRAWYKLEAAKELCSGARGVHEVHIGILEGGSCTAVVFGPSYAAAYHDGRDVPAGPHRWELEIVQLQPIDLISEAQIEAGLR